MTHPDSGDILASSTTTSVRGRRVRPVKDNVDSVRVAMATLGLAGLAAFAVATGAATLTSPAAGPAPATPCHHGSARRRQVGRPDAIERRNLAS